MSSFGANHPGFSRAYFDGMSEETGMVAFRLMQKDYRHDVAILDVYGSRTDLRRFRTGAPVEVEYGSGGRNTDLFYGYVNHLEPEIERLAPSKKQQVVRVVVVGPSWVLKEPVQRNMRGRTGSSIMREVAEAYKFTTDVDESDVVWDSVNSPGMSDWQFLVMVAKKMGNCFFCNKTEICSFDQFDHLRRRPGTTPVFIGPEAPGQSVTIDKFKAVSGETTPDGGEKALRVGHGIDPRTGEVFTIQHDPTNIAMLGRETTSPIFTKFEQGLVLESRAQAADRLTSLAKVNRFYIQATATLLGDVKVTQGSIVSLLGLGERNSGFWYVHEVEHILDGQSYEMEVKLGRDSSGSLGDEGLSAGRRTVRERYDPFDRRVALPPPTLLVNGQWRSAYAAKRQVV